MALFLSNLGAAGIILSIAIMLASGFLLTRITKRLHLPNVTGYIIAGVIIGPWCLNLVPSEYIGQMDFVTDLALAFICLLYTSWPCSSHQNTGTGPALPDGFPEMSPYP